MRTLGRHLIIELYDCDPAALDDAGAIRRALHEAAAAVGAEVLAEAVTAFEPQGVSGALVIRESHLSIHTWPELGYAAADVFTCGGLDPLPAFATLRRCLRAGGDRLQTIERGTDVRGRAVTPDEVALRTAPTAPTGSESGPPPSGIEPP